jgi:heparosan-N-sulfate-glucuronate 5-epimerase
MSNRKQMVSWSRLLVLGSLSIAACRDHAPTSSGNRAGDHCAAQLQPCNCTVGIEPSQPRDPASKPVNPTAPTEPDDPAAGGRTSSGTDERAGSSTIMPVADEPFTPPPTATPVADYAVDRGLTSYQTVPAKFDDVLTIDRYSWQSKYLNFEVWDLDNSPEVVPSERCVVEYKRGSETHCLPITLGNYALEKWSKYIAATPDAMQARDTFLQAADWFVEKQDTHGGWGADYAFDFWSKRAASLPSGWYSGMSQGLGISVLVRAYYLRGEERYLEAARRAVGVLRTPVEQGGVKRCVDGHAFYEEYPTIPMSNVLNGYMFAVIGLYDLSQLTTEPIYDAYFEEAIATVKAIISHYDLGSGTSYDLSHLQNPGEYPNRARWSYHALHVMQLSLLRSVTHDEFFTPIIDRWSGYLDGKNVHEN